MVLSQVWKGDMKCSQDGVEVSSRLSSTPSTCGLREKTGGKEFAQRSREKVAGCRQAGGAVAKPPSRVISHFRSSSAKKGKAGSVQPEFWEL